MEPAHLRIFYENLWTNGMLKITSPVLPSLTWTELKFKIPNILRKTLKDVTNFIGLISRQGKKGVEQYMVLFQETGKIWNI